MVYVRLNPNGRGAVHRGVNVDKHAPDPVWAAACAPMKRAWAYSVGVPREAIRGSDCKKCFR